MSFYDSPDIQDYLKPENVEIRKKESKKWDLEFFKKLKAKEGGIFGCYLDPRLLEHIQSKIKLPIGTGNNFLDYMIYPKSILEAVDFESYPIKEFVQEREVYPPDSEDVLEHLVCRRYHRYRREFSKKGENYLQPGNRRFQNGEITTTWSHCSRTHPNTKILDILEGLEFEPEHKVDYITLGLSQTGPIKIKVRGNYVKFPFPIYARYARFTYICILAYDKEEKEVEFSSLNTWMIGGCLYGYKFEKMKPCKISFNLNGKNYYAYYQDEIAGIWEVKDKK